MNFFRTLIYAALIGASSLAAGAEFSAKVIAVLDGDTVLVLRDGRLVKVRLAEIDAPEKAQIFGEESSRSLSGMVLGKQITITSQAIDQYGRLVAHISVNGLDVNTEQIRLGMAWEYSYRHHNRALAALQTEAKLAARGLWALADPVPPWKWRILHPVTPHTTDTPAPGATCGNKRFCSEMSSCEEAVHYMVQCGLETLDGNGDGVPCEALCAPLPELRN